MRSGRSALRPAETKQEDTYWCCVKAKVPQVLDMRKE